MSRRGTRPWQRPGRLIAGLTLTVVAVSTMVLWKTGTRGAEIANVLALPMALLGVLSSLWQLWPRVHPEEILKSLARESLRQREAFLKQALGIRPSQFRGAQLRFEPPSSGQLSEPAERLLVKWVAQGDPSLSGNQHDIAQLYQNLLRWPGGSGRLMVLGEPGTGKSVLLSFLTLDLLRKAEEERYSECWQVPVFLSLSSCDLGLDADSVTDDILAERLKNWMATRLVVDYGCPKRRTRSLVEAGRFITVLDGLDEMDPGADDEPAETRNPSRPRAVAVVRAINALTSDYPTVVASRRREYAELSAQHLKHVLTGQHVVLRPLTPAAIIDFLIRQFPAPRESDAETVHGDHQLRIQPAWQPVVEELARANNVGEDEHPAVVRVLANPWRLFLATIAFAESDPAALLGKSAPEINALLLETHVPRLVSTHLHAIRAHDWDPESVQGWLTTIAFHQQEARSRPGESEVDIHIPGLWRMANVPLLRFGVSSIIALLFAAMTACWVAEYTWGPPLRFDFSIFVDSAVCLPCLLLSTWFLWRAGNMDGQRLLAHLDLDGLRNAKSRRRVIRRSLRAGLTISLALALIATLASQPYPDTVALPAVVDPWRQGAQGEEAVRLWFVLLAKGWLFIGLPIGLPVGLLICLSGNTQTVPTGSFLLRRTRSFGLSFGAICGLIWILVDTAAGYDLLYTMVDGVLVGLQSGIFFGVTFGGLAQWIRYGIATWIAARQGVLPPRLTTFLDWCVSVGLMRMVGSSLQFRHRELQDYLAARSDEGRHAMVSA